MKMRSVGMGLVVLFVSSMGLAEPSFEACVPEAQALLGGKYAPLQIDNDGKVKLADEGMKKRVQMPKSGQVPEVYTVTLPGVGAVAPAQETFIFERKNGQLVSITDVLKDLDFSLTRVTKYGYEAGRCFIGRKESHVGGTSQGEIRYDADLCNKINALPFVKEAKFQQCVEGFAQVTDAIKGERARFLKERKLFATAKFGILQVILDCQSHGLPDARTGAPPVIEEGRQSH